MKKIKLLIFVIIVIVGISFSTLANSPPVQKEKPAVVALFPSVKWQSNAQDVRIQGFKVSYRQNSDLYAHEFSDLTKSPPTKNYFGQPPELVKLE